MFAVTLHHRPKINRRKGERESTLFSPFLAFSSLILYESSEEEGLTRHAATVLGIFKSVTMSD
jgi:hypothetical protein